MNIDKKLYGLFQLKASIVVYIILISVQFASAQNWPQWRGPWGTGSVPSGNPPVEWSEQKNIKWKSPLSGTGYSTPAVWENDIFVTAAIEEDGENSPVKFVVMALDRNTGNVKWERLAREEVPHQVKHELGAWAAASPITDGKFVYAFFGSRGLYCYTIEGDLVWEKDFGDMTIRQDMGEGSSPALYKDRLIVVWDHQGPSFVVTLDAATGEEIWRKNRNEPSGWMTPLIVENNGKVHAIVAGENRVISYDISNGDTLWEADGTNNNTATPVTANGIVYIFSGKRNSAALHAVSLDDAEGMINGSSAILWSYEWKRPNVTSPMLLDGLIYFLREDQGFLNCVNAGTGQEHYSNQRLEGIRNNFASPVGVDDRLILLSRDGVTLVVSNSPEYKVLAKNTLNDNFDASAVIVGDELYLRGHKYLYCIAEDSSGKDSK
ncbi:MAG: PQQ-binding-like beta-propeller repeat protein [bacterium]|nr:PQQ-binding-like beta-propeller repeat protein [bacterium]